MCLHILFNNHMFEHSQILVATPGRLIDHIDNTSGFATRLKGVKVLVLDEADHLLDMGFRRDIERIIAAVPKQRQTFLFSATVPEEVSVSFLHKRLSLLGWNLELCFFFLVSRSAKYVILL